MLAHISFDVWGTLLKSNFDFNRQRAIFLKNNFSLLLSIDQIIAIVKQNGTEINSCQEANKIQVSRELIFTPLCEKLNIPISNDIISQIDKSFQLIFIEYPPIIFHSEYANILKMLMVKGHTLSILSNTVYIKGEFISIVLHNILNENIFSFELYSDEVGFPKPSFKIYSLLKEMANNRKRIIHIGDNYLCDIQGPLEFGIITKQVHTNNVFITDFAYELE